MKTTMTLLIASSSLLLGGCVFAPSGSDFPRDERSAAVQPTTGQELIDLDRAREAGVISQAEFERAKARILDGRN